jgi:hypothetical protein
VLPSLVHAVQDVPVGDAAAIRDTIARVFDAASYDRSARTTIGGLILDAIGRVFRFLFDVIGRSPSLREFMLWSGFAILGVITVRFVYVARQRARLSAFRNPAHVQGTRAADPWLSAQAAAAAERYTEAAHLLYAALLQALSVTERVRLHTSKTAGDYSRELRARSSPAWPPFRNFVRAFELVVYGRRECDRAQFERLRSLAAPLVQERE